MKVFHGVAGLAAIAMVLAGVAGGVACRQRVAATPPTLSASSRPAPTAPKPKPECIQCAIEDLRQAAHKDQVEVTARYLGLKERWSDEHRTNKHCTRDRDVVGIVRFALIGANPWRDEFTGPPTRKDLDKMLEVDLPCPELSRPQYAKLYQYDPDDSERDGLGHAPVLRQGELYRLTFVRNVRLDTTEPSHPNRSGPVRTLVAVNPLRP